MWLQDSIIYSAICRSRSTAEFSVRAVENMNEVENKENEEKKRVEEGAKTAIEQVTYGLSGVPDKEKWSILSKELQQKQEIIHRMMREVDEKSESLKMTVGI